MELGLVNNPSTHMNDVDLASFKAITTFDGWTYEPFFTNVNKAAEEEVVVFYLPTHSMHKTQVLDKGVFGPVKFAWREVCHSYLTTNPGKVITRYQFLLYFQKHGFRP